MERVEPKSCNQDRLKNDAFITPATLSTNEAIHLITDALLNNFSIFKTYLNGIILRLIYSR